MFFPIGDDQVKGGHYPIVSYALIVLNVILFAYEATLDPEALNQFIMTWGALPVEITHGQDVITLLTSMFLHGGLMHLIGNMLFLWVFADNIEATVGSGRFAAFYLLGGLAAHLLHIFLNPESAIPTVGASGAISAVMGAYLVMFPRSQVKVLFLIFPFRISAFIFLGLWIIQQWMDGIASLQVTTAESVGVAYWAHIGGFAFGLAAGFYFRRKAMSAAALASKRYV